MGQTPLPSRLVVILFTDLVGSTALKNRLGAAAYSQIIDRHDALFRRCINLTTGKIVQGTGDGFFACFETASDAVRCALLFQRAVAKENWDGVELRSRAGIDVGEVTELPQPNGEVKLVGMVVDLASRIMSLATGGQVLLTRAPFNDARQFIREYPQAPDDGAAPALRWAAHGPYLFKGSDEPTEVFEVGGEGIAPLTAPPDAEKARRAVRPGEEQVLGWRPAVGAEMPGAPNWILSRKLGEGGFGEVWLAEQAKTSRTRVFKFCFEIERLRALKREVALFRLLKEALGDRPDTAKVIDFHFDSAPYFIEMEYAPEGNLTDWAQRQGGIASVPLPVRLNLIAGVAQAVAAAHSVGILHKDIKASNILIITRADGTVFPRLTDFGIGMLTDRSVLERHQITMAGFTVSQLDDNDSSRTGTRMYAPPESLTGRPFTVQGDIYAIGVLLFQIVVGDLNRPVAMGWEREVSDPILREDIAACVEGDPARRLGSATDLARRLDTQETRRLERKNVETARRHAARRRTFARLAMTAAAILAVAAAGAGWMALKQKRLADENGKLAGANGELAIHNGNLASRNDALAVEKGNLADHLRRTLSETDARTGHLLLEQGRDDEALPYEARALEEDGVNHAAVADALALLFRRRLPLALFRHDQPVLGAAFSPDGARVVTASWDKTARVWDAATGKPLTEPMRHEDVVWSAAFSPDGTRVVTASLDKTARVWDAATGKPIGEPMRHADNVACAAFSSDGTRVVTGSFDKTSRVWDAATGKPVGEPMRLELPVHWAAFSPDGTRVITASSDEAQLWDAATGKPLGEPIGHEGGMTSAVFSPDGMRVVTTNSDEARVWDIQSGKPVGEPMRHEKDVCWAIFSPDGTRVATASFDQTARVWDAATGKPLTDPMRHSDLVWSAIFSPDGTRIVTASFDNTARLWDAATGAPLGEPMRHMNSVRSAVFSPDGKRVVTASWDRTARVWNISTDKPLAEPMRHESVVNSAAFSSDGTRVVTASGDFGEAGEAQVWNLATGSPVGEPMRHAKWVSSAAFSRDGIRIVTASADKTAQVWDAASGKPLGKPIQHEDRVNSASFSPDGRRIVSACEDCTARLWDAATGKPLAKPMRHEAPVLSAAFSPNGMRVVTASHDGTARVWDATSGEPIGPPLQHEGGVWSAAFSPDGTRVVTACDDKTARVWDAVTGRSIGEAMKHEGFVYTAAFSPDGARLVTASFDNTARLWNAATGMPMGGPLRHDDRVHSAAFSPDGMQVVTASSDKTAIVWDVAIPAPTGSAFLARLCELATDRRLGPGGFAESVGDWMALRDALKRPAGSAGAPGSADRCMTWFLADHLHRTIAPFSSMTVAQWISNRLEENTTAGIHEVRDVDPDNPRCLARMARNALQNTPETYVAGVPIYLDLYSRRAVELAPKDAEVLWRRAAILAWLGRSREAGQLADRCPAPPTDDLWAWEARWEASVLLRRLADVELALAKIHDIAKGRSQLTGESLEQYMMHVSSLHVPASATRSTTLPHVPRDEQTQ